MQVTERLNMRSSRLLQHSFPNEKPMVVCCATLNAGGGRLTLSRVKCLGIRRQMHPINDPIAAFATRPAPLCVDSSRVQVQ